MVSRFLCVVFIFLSAYMSEALDVLNKCHPAKAYIDDNEPDSFNKTNNLLRRSGANPLYCGQKTLLEIEVVDKNCVPLSDAKIYLWQVGCDKKYPYKPLRNKANKHMFHPISNSTFLGSGIATTNNIGGAKFLTIYPPSIEKKGPHVNVRVEHKDLGVFQTKIFLKNYELIQVDDYEVIKVRIVTPWENIFRKY